MLRSWPGTPDAEAPDDVPDEVPDASDDDPETGVAVDREGPEPGRGLFAGLGSPSDIVPWRETMKYVDGYFEVRNQCTFGKLDITFGYFSLLSYPFSVFNLHQKCISIF